MSQVKRQGFFFAGVIVLIYVAAWLLQDRLFLNWDIGYLSYAADLLLSSGTYRHYSQDFFDPNPPLILYLYLPPVILSKFLHLNFILSFRGYIFLLISLVLGLCLSLLRKIFCKQDAVLAFVFFSTLAILFLLIPFSDFGQRDPLFFVLIMPYLLLVVCRLQGFAIGRPYAIAVGLLAGLGFGIKPQFLVTLLLIELYYLCRERNYLAWQRVEVGMIAVLLAVYALSSFILYPDFIFVVILYALRNFYPSLSSSSQELFFNNMVVFCYFAILFYGFQNKNYPYKTLSTVLLLALFGFLAAYFLQYTDIYYHLVPALSLAILLLSFFFTCFIRKPQRFWPDYLRMAIPSLFLLGFLVYRVKIIWVLLFFAPFFTFSFFGLLLAVLLYAVQENKNIIKVLGSLSCLLALGFLVFSLAGATAGYSSHQFLITTFTLSLLFGLLASRERQGVAANIFLALLAVLLFIYPAFFAYGIFERGLSYKAQVLDKLVAFMATQAPHRSIYALSVKANISSPLAYYSDSVLTQRFCCLWPISHRLKATGLSDNTEQALADENFFIGMVADDLHRQKPDLVFVDRKTYYSGSGVPFDYLVYLSRHEHFRTEWKAYHFLRELSEQPFFSLGVYERVTG